MSEEVGAGGLDAERRAAREVVVSNAASGTPAVTQTHINAIAGSPVGFIRFQLKQFSVQKDALRIDVAYSGVIRAVFRGRSALAEPETVLVPLFDQLSVDAMQAALMVDLHFEELEFFNSVTISCLIQCVLTMRDKGVRTSIRYDRRQQWQKVFFEALGMLRGSTGNLDVKAV